MNNIKWNISDIELACSDYVRCKRVKAVWKMKCDGTVGDRVCESWGGILRSEDLEVGTEKWEVRIERHGVFKWYVLIGDSY